MRNLNQILLLAACTGLLAGCGNAVTQKASSSETADRLKSMGPSLLEAEENPSLLEEFSCGANNQKVEICHVPPGNPNNRHTICIGRAAVDAHLAHAREDANSNVISDYLGECVADTGEEPGGEEPGGEEPGAGDGDGDGDFGGSDGGEPPVIDG